MPLVGKRNGRYIDTGLLESHFGQTRNGERSSVGQGTFSAKDCTMVVAEEMESEPLESDSMVTCMVGESNVKVDADADAGAHITRRKRGRASAPRQSRAEKKAKRTTHKIK